MSSMTTCNDSSGLTKDLTTLGDTKVLNADSWPIKPREHYRIFKQQNQGKDLEQVIREEALPSIARVVEIRDDMETPPQTALQAAQVILNKVLPDKIERRELVATVDLNKLFEMWSETASKCGKLPVDNSEGHNP
jgi:hydroxylamine reductase (hybrid-cluster protein)